MGKSRKDVTQPEHRRRRTFGGNRFSKRASEVVEEQPPILDVNIESGVNTTVNNSFC